MTVLERIHAMRATFAALLPHLPQPSVQDAARWITYDAAVAEAAIVRASQKFAASKIDLANFDVSSPYRYITATCRQTAARERESDAPRSR